MATNLNIDIKLLEHAYKLSGFKTKRETVNQALKEFIARREQKEILNHFGKVNLEESYISISPRKAGPQNRG